MKVAIYIEQGVTQLVLTPETPWEESVTKAVSNGEQAVTIYRASFYESRGGYHRADFNQDSSLILKCAIKPTEA